MPIHIKQLYLTELYVYTYNLLHLFKINAKAYNMISPI